MRWSFGHYLVVCALLVMSGGAWANDSAVISRTTEQLKSQSIRSDARIQLLFARGLAYDRMSQLDDAIADYSAILHIAPNNAAALNNRANAYRRQGRLLDAKRDYLASLVAGNSRPAYSEYGLGQVAEAEGDVSGARDYYRRALASDPGYALASQGLARLGKPEAFSAIHLKPPSGPDEERIILRRPGTVRPPVPRKPGWTKVAQTKPPKSSDVMLRPAFPEARAAGGKPAKSSGTMKVQLGAWRTRGEAQDGLAKTLKLAGDVLKGSGTEIVEANIPGKGRYFRLRVVSLSVDQATSMCAKLVARSLACIRAPH